MKKHPILYSFLCLLVLFVIYSIAVGLEIHGIVNYFKYAEENHSERHLNIGLEGLCKEKKIPFDENKEKIDESVKSLINISSSLMNLSAYFNDGIRYLELLKFQDLRYFAKENKFEFIGNSNDEDINLTIEKISTHLKSFDDVFKLDSINDYSWNMFESSDPLRDPLKTKRVYNTTDLCKISVLIGLLEIYTNKESLSIDSSVLFNSLLKIHLLNIYINKGELESASFNGLDNLFLFFDKFKKNAYSEQEMKNMLKTIKDVRRVIPDFNEFNQINLQFSKNLYDFMFKRFPVISNSISLFVGNPYKDLEKVKEMLNKREYRKIEEYLIVFPEDISRSLRLMFLVQKFGLIEMVYLKYNKVSSYLAVFQAYLEEKLGEKITATDPYDGKPVRVTTDSEGNKIYYCLGYKGIDSNGTGNNIINCDTSFKDYLIEKFDSEKIKK